MKVKVFSIFTILALLLVALSPLAALAGAYETSFTTSITYQNVGTSATTTLEVDFYDSPSDTTPQVIPRPNLAANASTSLFIGSLTQLGANFQGTAVLRADQPMISTLVQVPDTTQTLVKNRPLSNGFSSGSPNSQIATVLKNAFSGYYTVFSVQNVGGSATTPDIKFYDTTAALVHTISPTLQPGAGYFVDTGDVGALGTTFNGSVVIETVGGSIISSAMELQSGSGTAAYAFEGLGVGSQTFYMPSALCNYLVNGQATNTAYAVQNTSLSTPTSVTVTYSNGATETKAINPGAKQSFSACSASGMSSGFLGAATIASTATNVIAVGKAFGAGLSTAFVGFSSGYSKLYLPYVRYANSTNWANGSQQRAFITIQNIGGAPLSAGQVTVKYIDKNGVQQGSTHSLPAIPVGGKTNSNATNAGLSEFGVYPDGSFGGGAVIEGPPGSQLGVVVRVATQLNPSTILGEDYNGLPNPVSP